MKNLQTQQNIILIPRLSSQKLKRPTHTVTIHTKSYMLEKKHQSKLKKPLRSPSSALILIDLQIRERNEKKKNKMDKMIKLRRKRYFLLIFLIFIDFSMFFVESLERLNRKFK